MAKNATFAFASQGGSTSWADDDDMDLPTIPLKGSAPPAAVEQKSPRSPRKERKDSDDEAGGHHHHHHRHHHHRGDDRRGGRDEQPRQKNPVPNEGPFKLFVGNLPFSLNEDQLADFLGKLSIKNIRLPKEYDTGRPKGFAYVEFDDRESLVKALELDGHELMSRHVKMDVAVEKERKPRNNNSWYDKRGNGSHHDRPNRRRDENEGPREGDENLPKERPKLSLLPRTASTEKDEGAAAKKASIFGEAKPRDESLYLERQKSRELQKPKSMDESEKPTEGDEKKIERSTSGGRKHSDDFTRGGRGGRGGRGNKHEGGRGGRGDFKGGRGGKLERQSSKEKDAPAKKQQETRPKTVQQVKIAPPASTKTKNMFDLLDSDSDSDSD